MVGGLLGDVFASAAKLVEEESSTNRDFARTLPLKVEEKFVKALISFIVNATGSHVQFTVTGLHGAYLEYVAELVEEVLNTEADFATILLLQAVETHVRGHLVNQLPATRGHVQLMVTGRPGELLETVANLAVEASNVEAELAPIQHRLAVEILV